MAGFLKKTCLAFAAIAIVFFSLQESRSNLEPKAIALNEDTAMFLVGPLPLGDLIGDEQIKTLIVNTGFSVKDAHSKLNECDVYVLDKPIRKASGELMFSSQKDFPKIFCQGELGFEVIQLGEKERRKKFVYLVKVRKIASRTIREKAESRQMWLSISFSTADNWFKFDGVEFDYDLNGKFKFIVEDKKK